MNRNGFIFTVLLLTVASQAGPQLYLPAVGPVALRFAAEATSQPVATLPAESTISTTPENASRLDMIPELPLDGSPTNTSPAASSQPNTPTQPPAQSPADDPASDSSLVGTMLETNTIITPQMLMRFFAPMVNGGSRETIVIPPTGFTPARPPAQSSTIKFSKPKP